MLTLKIARAFIFNKIKITAFFKMINRIFATHDIIKDQKKKQWVLDYLFPLVA